jgi:hypothetical protein
MNIRVIILAQLLLLFRSKRANRLLDIAIGILAADHEANLAGRICRDGSVGVFDGGEDFFAVFLELGDQWQMEPLVLGCAKEVS